MRVIGMSFFLKITIKLHITHCLVLIAVMGLIMQRAF